MKKIFHQHYLLVSSLICIVYFLLLFYIWHKTKSSIIDELLAVYLIIPVYAAYKYHNRSYLYNALLILFLSCFFVYTTTSLQISSFVLILVIIASLILACENIFRSQQYRIKLENLLDETGRMAKVGGWELDLRTNKLIWTNETKYIHEVNLDYEPDLHSAINFYHPNDVEKISNAVQQAVNHGEPWDNEFRVITAKGKLIYTRSICKPVVENGKTILIRGTIQDITDKKQLENELEIIFNTSNVMICTADLNTYHFTRVNPAFTQTLGHLTTDFLQKKFIDYIHPDDFDKTKNYIVSLKKDSLPKSIEIRCKHKNNSYKVIEWYAQQMDVTGKAIAVAIDVTEKKMLQQESINNQNLRDIGVLAGGIAHDFNNIFMGLYGKLYIALDTLPKDHPAYESFKDAELLLARATNLTKQLLTFSKGGSPVKEVTDIKLLLTETVESIVSESNITFVSQGDTNPCFAKVDRSQFQIAFSNVVKNSKESMPDGGNLYVEFQNYLVKEGEYFNVKPGDYIKIKIQDEGIGIKESDLDQIFNPYFTTKEMGAGIGLSTVISIIKNHGGYIEVESKINEGSTFTIYVPSCEIQSDSIQRETQNRTEKPSYHILVLDDEKMICEVVSSMLNRLGHEVDFVYDGKEATEKYKIQYELGQPYNAVLMDLTIPNGMGGEEAVQHILKIDPNANCIVTSGYANNQVIANYKDYGFTDYCNKPFTISELVKVLDRAIQ